ncbi:MAG TPA: hypothetical protein VM733_10745 [Thermoanaerobaculia bacterium]|nr:hypothetical protein [Thermoanaerobaculia bacterium]
MSLEQDLKRALRRESPPEGFAARVLQRIERENTRQRPKRWWRAVAASLTLTAVLGAWGAKTVHERREGERARDQVLLALKIAGEKVRYAQQEVRTIGSND